MLPLERLQNNLTDRSVEVPCLDPDISAVAGSPDDGTDVPLVQPSFVDRLTRCCRLNFSVVGSWPPGELLTGRT